MCTVSRYASPKASGKLKGGPKRIELVTCFLRDKLDDGVSAMPKKGRASATTDETVELLKDLLIVQLGLAGIPQQSIRAIIGCDIVRVNKVVRHLKSKLKETGKKKRA